MVLSQRDPYGKNRDCPGPGVLPKEPLSPPAKKDMLPAICGHICRNATKNNWSRHLVSHGNKITVYAKLFPGFQVLNTAPWVEKKSFMMINKIEID
jgi:hypothetical protein